MARCYAGASAACADRKHEQQQQQPCGCGSDMHGMQVGRQLPSAGEQTRREGWRSGAQGQPAYRLLPLGVPGHPRAGRTVG